VGQKKAEMGESEMNAERREEIKKEVLEEAYQNYLEKVNELNELGNNIEVLDFRDWFEEFGKNDIEVINLAIEKTAQEKDKEIKEIEEVLEIAKEKAYQQGKSEENRRLEEENLPIKVVKIPELKRDLEAVKKIKQQARNELLSEIENICDFEDRIIDLKTNEKGRYYVIWEKDWEELKKKFE
jgi:hypothetical protein